MRAVRTFLVVGLLALAAWTPSRAAERVDLLLVLAADISRSVEHGIAGPVTRDLGCLRASPSARFPPRQRQREAHRSGDQNALSDALAGGEQAACGHIRYV